MTKPTFLVLLIALAGCDENSKPDLQNTQIEGSTRELSEIKLKDPAWKRTPVPNGLIYISSIYQCDKILRYDEQMKLDTAMFSIHGQHNRAVFSYMKPRTDSVYYAYPNWVDPKQTNSLGTISRAAYEYEGAEGTEYILDVNEVFENGREVIKSADVWANKEGKWIDLDGFILSGQHYNEEAAALLSLEISGDGGNIVTSGKINDIGIRDVLSDDNPLNSKCSLADLEKTGLADEKFWHAETAIWISPRQVLNNGLNGHKEP